MHKGVRRVTAMVVAALAVSGCVTRGNPVSDEEALASYPQTGIEAITGHWAGTWTQGSSWSTLRVSAEDPEKIVVRYCYGGWCAGGCSSGQCATYGNRLRNVRFEEEALRFKVKTADVVFMREGAHLHGVFNNKYTSRMSRQRK